MGKRNARRDEKYKENEAWEIVSRPENRNVIGSKWVYKIKNDAIHDKTVYKSKLVAQGCSQVKGVYYIETYAPVLMKKSVRILLAITVEKGWSTRHIDVKSAYLNS